MDDRTGNTLLNLDYLISNFQYSHLWQFFEDLMDSKLKTLEIINDYNDIKLSVGDNKDVCDKVEKEIYSLLIDLEFLNKNITTTKTAMQFKSKECIQYFDAGEHFLN